MSSLQCCGQRVTVSPTADIPTIYRPGQELGAMAQKALDAVKPWRRGEDPIETVTVARRLKAIVVPIDGREVLWARHRGHHARKVSASPFVRLERPATTVYFTVELAGSPTQPRLVRAYPGDYIPPLPWQNSVESAYDGVESAVTFWRENAYVLTSGVVVPGSTSHRAPSWFKV
jgi:hypothetical protein